MVERIPENFRVSAPNAIASFDGVDFSLGTAFKLFYVAVSESSDIVDFSPHLTPPGIASGALVTNTFTRSTFPASSFKSNGNTELAERVTATTTFQRPAIIEGDALFNIPCYTQSSGGNQSRHTASGALTLTHNGTDTTLASFETQQFNNGTNENVGMYFSVKESIARTRIRDGDELTYIIELIDQGSNANFFIALAHDPAGTTPHSGFLNGTNWPSSHDTAMFIALPFVIDL